MELMLLVVACYTVCSLNDKYAVAKVGLDGNRLTFIMASATAFFMLFYLPFAELRFSMCWQSFAFIVLLAASKMIEFQTAALVLKEMSAFELKAWLGICLFASYFTDVLRLVESLSFFRIGFIAVTATGLFLIAKSGGDKINYKKIVLPLIVYIAAKYGYGMIITYSEPYISSTPILFFALILISLVLLPKVGIKTLFKDNLKGKMFVILAKIPNVIGLVAENAVIAVSMSDYAFIQPMILVTLFAISFIQKEKRSVCNLIGGIVCVIGIIGFQLIR